MESARSASLNLIKIHGAPPLTTSLTAHNEYIVINKDETITTRKYAPNPAGTS
jgi:hypothetical protein